MLKKHLSMAVFAAGLMNSSVTNAEGEAGILSLRGQGHFYVGLDVKGTR